MNEENNKEETKTFKEKLSHLDNEIDYYKNSINYNKNIVEGNINFLRKLDPNVAEEEELIAVYRRLNDVFDTNTSNNQKKLKALYDEKYEVEKEQRDYYRKEYEGYKETKDNDNGKQADDGRVGE